jgi:hypothetical protein
VVKALRPGWSAQVAVHSSIAEVHLRLHQPLSALQSAEAALAIDRESAEARLRMALAESAVGR